MAEEQASRSSRTRLGGLDWEDGDSVSFLLPIKVQTPIVIRK